MEIYMPDKIICNKCIVKVEFHNFIANLVSTGLNITIKSGETYTFVVWHRQDIKNYLDYKKG